MTPSLLSLRFWQGVVGFGLAAVLGDAFWCVYLLKAHHARASALCAIGVGAGALVAFLARLEWRDLTYRVDR